MKRILQRLVPLVLAVVAITPGVRPAHATLGPPIQVRWSGVRPEPARAGQEIVGGFELVTAGRGGLVENLEIGGEGWSVSSAAPRTVALPAQARRSFAFRAVPADPEAPLVVRGTIDGMPFRKEFRLDERTLGRPKGPGLVRSERAPILSGVAPSKGATARTAGQSIRIRGRLLYTRQDNQSIGADNVVVIVMDDDSPAGDEEIGRFLTNSDGTFDQTLNWDDCDISGCDDPDIYLVYEAANLVVEVRRDVDDYDMYKWSTEGNTIEDFTGNDIDFGLQFPIGDDAALHIYTSIVRTHRTAQADGGMNAPHTFVHWPSTATNGAFYSDEFNQVHIGMNETWTEGTHVHEYGHHLSKTMSILVTPSYNNGFCDTPTPGHCLWCPENSADAWQEGFANWLGSLLVRKWFTDYGVVPLSLNDFRYTVENTLNCQQDNQPYLTAATEGVTAAILRDIEDASNENDGGGAADCRMDVLTLGADEIFTVFRDDDPTSIGAFVTAFRARWPQHDANLWATIGNTAPSLLFTQPAPVVTSQPAPCRFVRVGESLTLTVESNSALHTYMWRRNGVPIANGGGLNGVTTKTLTMNPVTPAMAGDWDCVVTNCEGGLSVTSEVSRVDLDFPPRDQPLVSWGENGSGQAGDGTQTYSIPPHFHGGLPDIVAADGGRSFTMALSKNGDVRVWGLAYYGELGNGGYAGQLNAPPAAPILTDAVKISAGHATALAVLRDGTIRGWGRNLYGQAFTGDGIDRHTPTPSALAGCVRDVAGSEVASIALLDDGTVWAVGHNGYGQLGQGTTGGFSVTPVQVQGLGDVIDIDAGGEWFMALRADSTVWTWGGNDWGQLGLGHYSIVATPTQVPGLTGIKQISAGQDHAHAVRSDHRAFGWGYGPAIGIGWNGGASNVPQLLALENISMIMGGSNFAMALIDGRLKGWGLNAGVYPPMPGVLNNTGPYVQGTPVDIPGVGSITGLGPGWGTMHVFGVAEVTDVTPPPAADRPLVLALAAQPNPARGTAAVRFDLPDAAPVSLRVYDAAGRFVRELVDETRESGRHATTWDGRSAAGDRVAAGLYFLRLQAGERMVSRALVRLD